MPLPPVDEQAAICAKVESVLAAVGAIAQRIDGAERATRRTLEAITGKAFRGELMLAEAGAKV